jgi:hypothetical protein
VEMKEVPWNRIVHFYGRATDVPSAIADLNTERHASAEKMLLHNLEHQDGVIQATPIAVTFIAQALREGKVRDRAAVEALLARILASAQFQLDGQGRPSEPPTIEALLVPESLWPENDEDDEVLWEEWPERDVDVSGWAALTEQVIVDAGIGLTSERTLGGVPKPANPTPQTPWWQFW